MAEHSSPAAGFDLAARAANPEHSAGMSRMLKSSGALGAATLASRLLGMVREMVYASFMGVGWVTDAFLIAFMVPNLFRRLLGEGALTAAFIPIFKEKETTAGEKEMWHSASAVMSVLLAATTGLALLAMAGITVALWIGNFTAPTLLMLKLLRLMFPYLILVCVAAVFMAILNARGHFFIPALGPSMLNVVMVGSVLWLAPAMGATLPQQIFGLGIGVLIAGAAQALFQVPLLLREGYRWRWVTPWRDETVRRVLKLMIPGAIGVAAFHLNVLLTQGLSFWVGEGIVSSYGYAVRLMELPQGVFGISMATYLLPTLSGFVAEKKYDEFRATLAQGLGYLVFMNLLASVLLLVLAEPIIRLLFERGAFDAADTGRSTLALACLAPSLVAYSSVNVLARAFYALGDTQTPMRISVFCLAANLVFVAVLVWPLQQGGLGVANSLSAFINVTLLLYALRRKLARLEFATLRRHLFTLLGAALAAGLVAWGAWRGWSHWVGCATLLQRIGEVFVPMALATGTYFGLTLWLKVGYPKDVLGLLLARLRRKSS